MPPGLALERRRTVGSPPASRARCRDDRGATGPTNRGSRRVDGDGSLTCGSRRCGRAGNANRLPGDLHSGLDGWHGMLACSWCRLGRGRLFHHHSGGPHLTRSHIGGRRNARPPQPAAGPNNQEAGGDRHRASGPSRATHRGAPPHRAAHRGLGGGGQGNRAGDRAQAPRELQLLTEHGLALRAGAEMLGYIGRQGRRRDPGPQVSDGLSSFLAGHSGSILSLARRRHRARSSAYASPRAAWMRPFRG